MASVKDTSRVSAKWARVTPQRAEDFTIGVQNPRVSWLTATRGAEDRYKAGVLEAANAGRFGKGVAAAGDQGWQQKTLAKGPGRFAEGVAISAPDYEAAVAPYLDTIRATTLPPRFPKGDPRNLERTKAIAMALRKRKTG